MMQSEDSDNLQIVPDPDKLERYHRHQLSAMLDGELSPDQARFMLRRLQHDTDLAGCWERWQVCGDVLRGHHHALLPPDFAGRVSAAIAGDRSPVQARARNGAPRLLRWGGGAALAASVAMAALLVGRQGTVEPGQVPPQALPALAAGGQAAVPEAAVPVPVEPAPETTPAAPAVTALAAADATRRISRARAATRDAAPADGARASSQSPAAAQLVAVTADAPAAVADAAPAMEQAVADAAPGLAPPAGEGIGSDPFRALPMTVASRPWPRAAAGAGERYSVGFGGAFQEPPAWAKPLGPMRPGALELFGLPGSPAPRLTGATAIGARPVPVQGPDAPAAAADPR